MVHMLLHLMLEAQYQDGYYMGVEIKRGQLATGRKQLSADTGLSEREVRTCLDRLVNDQQIVIKTTNRFSIITICNYDSWQCNEKVNDQQTTSQTPQNDQPNDHIQISKINNKDKEEDTNVSKKKESESELEKQFETFRRKYKSYGGVVRGFQTELDAFKKKHKDWKEVIPCLEYAIDKENEARMKADAQKIFFARMQNLKTYLSQRSWEAYSEGWEDYDPDAYHPDGLTYDAEFDAYRFYPCNPNYDLNDGYTADNRPDGARIVEQINVYVWSKDQRIWIRQ